MLIQDKADVNALDLEQDYPYGYTPLQVAVAMSTADSPGYIAALLAAKADVNAPGPRQGKTALHFAVNNVNNASTAISMLLEAKANADTADDRGWTPLHLATIHKKGKCLSTLLEGKADVQATFMHHTDDDQYNPLLLAVKSGYMAGITMLLEGKADVNAVNTRGETMLFPLELDARYQRDDNDIVDLLLEQKADISIKDKYGTTVAQARKRPVEKWHVTRTEEAFHFQTLNLGR
jgi:ankyrin repeat protein